MTKKIQITSLALMGWVVLFFVLFLHPVFLVRFFQPKAAYIFFRFSSGVTSLSGLVGASLYLYVFSIAIRTKQHKKPILWFQLPLFIITITMTFGFLIPLTLSK
ncbi:hypothetical protein ACFL1M_01110 [Patescibacteria group bacterium]